MKRFKKPMHLWLGKDRNDQKFSFNTYSIGTRKKEWDGADFDKAQIASFCGHDFERVTGIKLEPGEVVKVRIVIDDSR